MTNVKLTQAEIKWLARLEKTLDAAPRSLKEKVRSFTIGDDEITVFDAAKYDDFESSQKVSQKVRDTTDVNVLVDKSGSKIKTFNFPFLVESTSG